MKYIYYLLPLLVLASCGSKKEGVQPEQETLPMQLFSEVNETSLTTLEAKKVKAGDSVVVKGKVMGHIEPFVKGRASFIIGDLETITSCELMGDDDHCETPWDACCEGKKALRAGTLNIQVLNEQGRVIKADLKGKNGLKELSHVVVKGTVDSSSTEQATVINATSIQVIK